MPVAAHPLTSKREVVNTLGHGRDAQRFNRTLLTEWATPAPGRATAWPPEASTDSYAGTTLNEATPPSAENQPSVGSPPDNNVSGHAD